MSIEYDEEFTYLSKKGKRIILWIIGLSLVLSAVLWTCSMAKKATHIDDAVIVYEEYQEIYNTCSQLNTDLCNMKDVPETDKMFEQFSKPQRVLAIKTNLNRWVETYNAKSKMWGRQLWKSNKLPYELSVNEFNCYTSKN
jgi:hypothetical protein